MLANNLFCLFVFCKQFFSTFFPTPLQMINGPSLITDDEKERNIKRRSALTTYILRFLKCQSKINGATSSPTIVSVKFSIKEGFIHLLTKQYIRKNSLGCLWFNKKPGSRDSERTRSVYCKGNRIILSTQRNWRLPSLLCFPLLDASTKI